MISDLKDFEKMLKLCRKYGVSEIDHGAANTTVKFGELPQKELENSSSEETMEELSPEQLAFYAVGG